MNRDRNGNPGFLVRNLISKVKQQLFVLLCVKRRAIFPFFSGKSVL